MCRLSWNTSKFTALFLWGNRTIVLYNKQNNTWMLANMKLFLVLNKDISLVCFAHSWDILVNTRNKFHISTHPCIILYLKKWFLIWRASSSCECSWEVGVEGERFERGYSSVFLWRRANARNVRLYCPYWQYTDLFIFRFVTQVCLLFRFFRRRILTYSPMLTQHLP